MPLPNPQEGESRNDFMGRCVIDPNIINDFDTIEQRVAVCSTLFDPQKETKAQDDWENDFENQLEKAERTSVRDFTEFYKAEYNDAIDLYLRVGQMTQATAQGFFQDAKYIEMYEGMYSKIGLQFANWYSKNVQKYMPKADPANMESIWRNAFAFMGQQVGTQSATMVSSTAQATLTNTIRQFMADPVFQSGGEVVQAKMLRQKFDHLADYQARRIVRTEATNAANYATEQAALNLFAGQDMTKTWRSGYDARVRDAHRAANGQVVPFNSKFSVGGESLQRPGDPNASASNRINCRCSMIVLPKAGANTIGPQITNIGFGMAQAEVVDAISSAMIAPEVIATVVAETAVSNISEAKTIKEAEKWAIENNIAKIVNYDGLDIESANKINNTLKMVFNDFGIDPLAQIVPGKYKKGSGALASANGFELEFNKLKYSKDYIKDSFDRNVTNFTLNNQQKLENWEKFRGFYTDRQINKAIRETKNSLLYNRHNVFTSEAEFIENVFIHESAHMIEDQLLARLNGTRFLQPRFKEGVGYQATYNDSVRNLRMEYENIYLRLSQQEKSLISAYGATDSSETLAEALVMYYKEPNIIPISLKNFFDKLKQHGRR